MSSSAAITEELVGEEGAFFPSLAVVSVKNKSRTLPILWAKLVPHECVLKNIASGKNLNNNKNTTQVQTSVFDEGPAAGAVTGSVQQAALDSLPTSAVMFW